MHDYAAESIEALYLLETGTVRRPPDRADGTLDRATMTVTYSAGEVVYSGPAGLEAGAADRTENGRRIERSVLDLPRGTTSVRIGDIYQPTSRPTEGRAYRIVRAMDDTSAPTDRYEVELATQLPTASGG